MGVDVSHIIRHDFKDVKNHVAAMDSANKTIQMLKNNLHIFGVDDEFELRKDDGNISFHRPKVYSLSSSSYIQRVGKHKRCYQ